MIYLYLFPPIFIAVCLISAFPYQAGHMFPILVIVGVMAMLFKPKKS